MSLASLNFASAANEGRVMTLLHPTEHTVLTGDKGEPITITLLGLDSDTFIAAENAARNRAVEQIKEGVKFSAAATDEERAATLARATTAWSGVIQGWIDGTEDETPAKFSFENAKKLYANNGVRWIRTQADKFIGDRANFLPPSATN